MVLHYIRILSFNARLFDSGAERYQKLRSIVMQNTAPQV